MSYNFEFTGGFKLDKPLSPEHLDFLKVLNESRRAKWQEEPIRDGERPDGYCSWIPSDDGEWIQYDNSIGGIFFFIEWLGYLIERFLKPWGYVLNGEVYWQGEEDTDYGVLVVKDNVMDDLASNLWTDQGVQKVCSNCCGD